MRVFSEESLKQLLANAGFCKVAIASQDVPEFGVLHNETWSLPIVARKGRFQAPAAELANEYRAACRRVSILERELAAVRADYEKFQAHHHQSQRDLENRMAERLDWVRKVEQDFEERTQWALSLQNEKKEAIDAFRHQEQETKRAWQRVDALEQELAAVQASHKKLESQFWTRLGRKLGAMGK